MSKFPAGFEIAKIHLVPENGPNGVEFYVQKTHVSPGVDGVVSDFASCGPPVTRYRLALGAVRITTLLTMMHQYLIESASMTKNPRSALEAAFLVGQVTMGRGKPYLLCPVGVRIGEDTLRAFRGRVYPHALPIPVALVGAEEMVPLIMKWGIYNEVESHMNLDMSPVVAVIPSRRDAPDLWTDVKETTFAFDSSLVSLW